MADLRLLLREDCYILRACLFLWERPRHSRIRHKSVIRNRHATTFLSAPDICCRQSCVVWRTPFSRKAWLRIHHFITYRDYLAGQHSPRNRQDSGHLFPVSLFGLGFTSRHLDGASLGSLRHRRTNLFLRQKNTLSMALARLEKSKRHFCVRQTVYYRPRYSGASDNGTHGKTLVKQLAGNSGSSGKPAGG